MKGNGRILKTYPGDLEWKIKGLLRFGQKEKTKHF
jgi:hypothetical protein